MVWRRQAGSRHARRHGQWYKGRHGLVSVRWVFARDTTGTHRDEYIFTTDPALTPAAVIGHYCGRWDIETTSEDARSAVGLETTRGRRKKTALRAAPRLLGLYTVVALLYAARPAAKPTGAVSWPGKATVAFPDAMRAARRWLWNEAVLPQAGDGTALPKLPEPIRGRRLTTLAPAT